MNTDLHQYAKETYGLYSRFDPVKEMQPEVQPPPLIRHPPHFLRVSSPSPSHSCYIRSISYGSLTPFAHCNEFPSWRSSSRGRAPLRSISCFSLFMFVEVLLLGKMGETSNTLDRLYVKRLSSPSSAHNFLLLQVTLLSRYLRRVHLFLFWLSFFSVHLSISYLSLSLLTTHCGICGVFYCSSICSPGWQKTEQRGSAAGRKQAIDARSATLLIQKFWKEISEKVRQAQFQ